MKERFRNYASGTEDIKLDEITGKPYKVKKAVVKTREQFCFDPEGKDLPVGAEYTVIETLNDGDYLIYKSTQSGSNPGFWVEHSGSGDLYYFKTGNGQQNITEHVSAQLYRAAGIETPEMNLVGAPGFKSWVSVDNCWIKSKAIAGMTRVSAKPEAAYEGFAVDAWLANWDAVCSGNTLLKDGHAVRVDFGGTLNFRARGGKKAFGNKVSELSTLLDPNINPESAAVFSKMTREDLISSLKRVQSVTDEDINNLYTSVHTYMNPELFTTIRNRKKYLNYVLKEAENIEMKPNQTIQEYIKEVEASVEKKYAKQIAKTEEETAQRARVMKNMKQKRDAVMDEDDLTALTGYKNSCYTANTQIEQGMSDSNLALGLDKALNKTAVTEDIVLYRGEHLFMDSHLNSKYVEILPEYKGYWWEKVLEEEKASYIGKQGSLSSVAGKDAEISDEMIFENLVKRIYKKGRVIEENKFISTTISEDVAKNFGKGKTDVILRYHVPKGTKGTTLENFSPEVWATRGGDGVSGDLCGRLEGSEAEILLKRGFKYRMDDLTFENGKYIIDCTILK